VAHAVVIHRRRHLYALQIVSGSNLKPPLRAGDTLQGFRASCLHARIRRCHNPDPSCHRPVLYATLLGLSMSAPHPADNMIDLVSVPPTRKCTDENERTNERTNERPTNVVVVVVVVVCRRRRLRSSLPSSLDVWPDTGCGNVDGPAARRPTNTSRSGMSVGGHWHACSCIGKGIEVGISIG